MDIDTAIAQLEQLRRESPLGGATPVDMASGEMVEDLKLRRIGGEYVITVEL